MSWRDCTLGELVHFQRGHDLPDQDRKPGNVPVIGSAGPNGWHDEAKAIGPGVSIGRSGASIGKVTYTPVDYWPHNACLYVTDFFRERPAICILFSQDEGLRIAKFRSSTTFIELKLRPRKNSKCSLQREMVQVLRWMAGHANTHRTRGSRWSAPARRNKGSYSVICWYGPFPIAPAVRFGGSRRWPQP